MADCGLPSFKPNATEGFDIETIDYDEDDLAEASKGLRDLRLLDEARNTTNSSAIKREEKKEEKKREFGST